MGVKLESLIVDLQVQSAQLRAGLDSANSKLSSFGGQVKQLAARMREISQSAAVMMGKQIAEGLGHFVLAGAEAADKMGKLAQAIGLPVEAMSRLAYAASLSDLSTEQLGHAAVHLNKNMAAAAAGGGAQAAVFMALGVSIKDAGGHLRSTDAVMAQLADRFASMQDGAAKSALAVEVFGKGGEQLIPMLNGGADGLKKMAAEADRLGVTISASTAKAAEEFNDNLTRLKAAVNGVAVDAAGQLAPALSRLTEELLKSKDGASALHGAAEVLAALLKVVASVAVTLAAAFQAIGTNIGRMVSAVVSASQGKFDELLNLPVDSMNDTLEAASTAVDRLKAIWSQDTGVTAAMDKQERAVKKSADGILKQVERIKKDLADAGDTKELGKEYEKLMKSFNASYDRAQHGQKNRVGSGTSAAVDKGLDKAAMIEDPLQDFSNRLKQVFNEQLQHIGEALKFGGNLLLSKLGDLGQVIQSGIQGFQQGGVWGAIIAVVIEMLSRFDRFKEILNIANGQLAMFLGDTKEGLGSLVDGLKQIMGGIGVILKSVHGILNPIFKFIGQLLGKLSSIFAFIGVILEPIGAVLEMLFGALQPILDILDMLEPILRVFAIIILGVVRALFTINNAIMDLLDVLSFGIFHGWIQKLKVNTDKIDKQIDQLMKGKSLTDLSNEAGGAAENIGKMSDAAKEAGRELTNMPQGFKVVLEEYYATLAHNLASDGNNSDRNNFLNTGNPTTSNPGASGAHDSGDQGGSKGNHGGSHHGDA